MPFPVHLHIVKPQCPQAELVINVEVIQNPPVGELTHVGDLNILQFHRKHKPLRGRYPAPKEQQAHQHSNTRALHAGFPLASLPLPGDFFHRRRVVNFFRGQLRVHLFQCLSAVLTGLQVFFHRRPALVRADAVVVQGQQVLYDIMVQLVHQIPPSISGGPGSR